MENIIIAQFVRQLHFLKKSCIIIVQFSAAGLENR